MRIQQPAVTMHINYIDKNWNLSLKREKKLETLWLEWVSSIQKTWRNRSEKEILSDNGRRWSSWPQSITERKGTVRPWRKVSNMKMPVVIIISGIKTTSWSDIKWIKFTRNTLNYPGDSIAKITHNTVESTRKLKRFAVIWNLLCSLTFYTCNNVCLSMMGMHHDMCKD